MDAGRCIISETNSIEQGENMKATTETKTTTRTRTTKATKILLTALLITGLISCSEEQQNNTTTKQTTQQTYNWKMVTTWPVDFPIFQEGAERFAEKVKAASQGQLQVQVFAGGELVPALGTFDAVSQGSVEMGHGSAYYWAGKVPAAQFFSTVPFGMSADDMQAWLHDGGGLELWQELYANFNLIPIPMGNTGTQMGGWFNKRIDSTGDLKGLRMRIPGLGGKVLALAGGNPVLQSGAELYTALERGVIDATEWVAPFHDTRLGLQRAAKYYYYPGWHEPGTEFELIINKNAWNTLPQHIKNIVELAAAEAGRWIYLKMKKQNSEALAELRKNPNIEILPFPPQVLTELHQLTKTTLQQAAQEDEQFNKVWQHYEQFKEQMNSWNSLGEEAMRKATTDNTTQ